MSDFARIAAVSLRVHLGDVEKNKQEILKQMRELEAQGVQAAVFPELCITGYTLGDLLLHKTVQESAYQAMEDIAAQTHGMAVVIGLPVNVRSRLYNCAAVLQNGEIKGIVPKTYLPNGNEFYETRWFVSGEQADVQSQPPLAGDLLFDMGDFTFAVEICEDLWTPIPPSSRYAVEGADIILNPSASNALVTKHAYRRELLKQQSGRLYAGYAYACSGFGESTSDLAFCGYTGIYESGRVLGEGERFTINGSRVIADIDVRRLRYQRQRNGSFHQMPRALKPMTTIPMACAAMDETAPLLRPIAPLPFVPPDGQGEENLAEIVNIQCTGLMTRMEAIHCKHVVIGVSGGLDSTLALLVAARTFDKLRLDRRGIYAITMPGMGTGTRTKSNAWQLMETLNATALEIPIETAVKQHFRDIGQDENKHDVTYENCQARERTQILMDYANKVQGIVLGTGDMSEMALGFATYNGDHMSMYNVNCSIPKTLVKRLVRHLSEHSFGGAVREVCEDVLDTPISPELLPVSEGELSQRTEEIIGDYALHDFFLYHLMDSGSGYRRLRRFAVQAFAGVYTQEKITAQLTVFLHRFFTQQYKRNCVPDGPKVGSVSLSPRGDWRMPSDMDDTLWRNSDG
ncbi:MAG TPA: NAD(+) synthase [Candidatus Limiplasma sp.]|nr:NAD(+) synthase [Candidatus Limiplasma sp.]